MSLADEGLLRNQGRWVVLGMFSSVCSQRPGYVLTMSAQISEREVVEGMPGNNEGRLPWDSHAG